MSHLEQRLENDLQNLRSKILEQASKVQTGVNDAVHALQTGNNKLAYATILNDYPINRRMREIDRLCHKFIAIHLPSGAHLRLLSSIIRINIELERMGDYAVTIAREAVQLNSPPEGTMGREIDRLASETLLMLKQSIMSFEELNPEQAKSTILMAGSMEYNLDTVYQEIIQNTQKQKAKDILAIFVIFTQLKRVADQAKNLCEDTIFAATGQQKTPKVFSILFIDEDNSTLSQLAVTIARKNYPDICSYQGAGRTAAANVSPELVNFLDSRGDDTSHLTTSSLADLTHQEITDQHVIVSLQGDVSSYLDSIPFHTTALEWDISPEPDVKGQQDMEILYRTLALHIKDLLELLRGDEV
jgi:phosphate transport system protein